MRRQRKTRLGWTIQREPKEWRDFQWVTISLWKLSLLTNIKINLQQQLWLKLSHYAVHVTPKAVSGVLGAPHVPVGWLTPSGLCLEPPKGPLTAWLVGSHTFSSAHHQSGTISVFHTSFFLDSDRAQEKTHLASAEQGRGERVLRHGFGVVRE